MKNIYFILAVMLLFVQSCTIQKRQHLPGYHIEWNTNDGHSEVQREKKPEQALDIAKQDVTGVSEVIAQPLKQELEANVSDIQMASPKD